MKLICPGISPVTVLASAVLMIACCSFSVAQTQDTSASPNTQKDLPKNWQRLSARDFAYAVDPFYDTATNRPRGPFDERAVRQHAAKLFLTYDLSSVPLSDFPTIYRLYRAGWRELTDEQNAAMGAAVASRRDDWTGRSYEENLSKVMLMDWEDIPLERMSQDVIRFFDAGGQYEDVWRNDLQDYARLAVRNPQVVNNNFTVRWEGQITAPQSGQYTFFISPVNTSQDSLNQSMKVIVSEQELISATPEKWTDSSEAVQLTAGKPVSVEVEFTVKSTDLPRYAVHAILSWKGPGISRTVIPIDRFTVPDGKENGLQATYSWTSNAKDASITRVDGNIDFAWTSSDVIVSGDTSIKESLLEQSWQKQTSDEFLDALVDENGKPIMHAWTINPYFSSQNLSSRQREKFLKLLQNRPELLDAFSARRITNLYRAYRFGATETALDLFGQWAFRNANSECEMTADGLFRGFDFENRKALHIMAVCVTPELPRHAKRLQDEFLEMPDGSCCLPVAYTLGYSYLLRNKLNVWTDILETKLAQNALSGDKRVNWLIARAHAREIRLGRRNPRALVKDRPLDGLPLLAEALSAAEAPDLKLLVAKQIAVRYSATKQFNKARRVLEEATATASADGAARVAQWRTNIDKLAGDDVAEEASRAARVKTSYIQAMQRRRDRAAATGNTKAVERYNALIKAALQK